MKTAPPMSLTLFLTNLVPTSIIDAMARNEVLQIVIFALLAGIALTQLGEKGQQLLAITEQLANLVLKMAMFVMNLAPIAVFAAVAATLAEGGIEIVGKYASYVGGFYLALALLWLALMMAGAAVLGWTRQKTLMTAIREPALIALATTSSESAYPVLLYKLEQIGVSGRIASFVLPLGYSFNLIGSMCYCTFALLFVAQAYRRPAFARPDRPTAVPGLCRQQGHCQCAARLAGGGGGADALFPPARGGGAADPGGGPFSRHGPHLHQHGGDRHRGGQRRKVGRRCRRRPSDNPARCGLVSGPRRTVTEQEDTCMTLDHTATGVYSIAPTPFLEDGSIDWTSVDRMTDFYFEAGCKGFTILGVLGEAPKLDAEEALALAARVIKLNAGGQADHRSGVFGARSLAAMRSLARKVMEMGAAGVMIAPGAGLKTDDQIAAYFRGQCRRSRRRRHALGAAGLSPTPPA